MKRRDILERLAVLSGALLLWQLLYASAWISPAKLPGPGQVFASLSELARGGALAHALASSLGRVATGYLLAALVGLLLGVALFQYAPLARSFGALVPGFLSLPAAAWLPICLLWFKDSPEKAILLMIFFGAVFSITHATEQGMRHVPPVLVRAARTMGSSGWRLSTTVLLPSALPSVLTGLKQGWAFAWRALMTAELVAEGLGFGNLLKQGQRQGDMAMLLGLIFVILLVGLAVDALLFGPVERAVRRRYGLEHQEQ